MVEHTLRVSRFNRGISIPGGRTVFGTWGRCSCGWKSRSNDAPSKGGTRQMEARHVEHVREVVEG